MLCKARYDERELWSGALVPPPLDPWRYPPASWTEAEACLCLECTPSRSIEFQREGLTHAIADPAMGA